MPALALVAPSYCPPPKARLYAVRRCPDRSLKGTARALMAYLLADDRGGPSLTDWQRHRNADICRELNRCVSAVHAAKVELEAKGYIRWRNRYAASGAPRYGRRRDQIACEFRVTPDFLELCRPALEELPQDCTASGEAGFAAPIVTNPSCFSAPYYRPVTSQPLRADEAEDLISAVEAQGFPGFREGEKTSPDDDNQPLPCRSESTPAASHADAAAPAEVRMRQTKPWPVMGNDGEGSSPLGGPGEAGPTPREGSRRTIATPQALAALWNAVARSELPRVWEGGPPHSGAILDGARARLLEKPDLNYWRLVFERVNKAGAFCRGDNDSGWVLDFADLMTSPGRHAKVMAGRYEERGRGRASGEPSLAETLKTIRANWHDLEALNRRSKPVLSDEMRARVRAAWQAAVAQREAHT